jgi:hypothetical protein
MEDDEYAESRSERGQLIVAPGAVIFSLSPEHRKQARECLRRSGEIRISIQELSVTSLTEVRELTGEGVIID